MGKDAKGARSMWVSAWLFYTYAFLLLAFVLIAMSEFFPPSVPNKHENAPGVLIFQGEMARIVIVPQTVEELVLSGARLQDAKTSTVKELELRGYKVTEEKALFTNVNEPPCGYLLRYRQK